MSETPAPGTLTLDRIVARAGQARLISPFQIDVPRLVLVLEECPFCHKFLAAELVSKQEVDTAEMLKEKDVFYRLGVPVETGERIADNPEMFPTYKLGFKCRQCGKEWSKLKVESVQISQTYAESEDEASEYDAEKEEEEAREEQYAEE